MAERTLKLTAIVGDRFCIASDDGNKVYTEIKGAIERGDKIRLSFEGVEDLTSVFLNAAIGQLYSEFTEDQIKSSMLAPIDISAEDLELLARVVRRAKEYFNNPDPFRKASREIFGNGE